MKVRFDGLDVTAMVAHVQRTFTGRRVVNIYDNPAAGGGGGGDSHSTYLFKFEKQQQQQQQQQHSTGAVAAVDPEHPQVVSQQQQQQQQELFLLLESGIRFHGISSEFQSETAVLPLPFCSKLRKHLRGLRLESVVQLGGGNARSSSTSSTTATTTTGGQASLERVVLFTFFGGGGGGGGPQKFGLILELYAKGNIILTDHEFRILALLRSHVYESHDAAAAKDNSKTTTSSGNAIVEEGNAILVQVGQVYPVAYATSWKNKKTSLEVQQQQEQYNSDSNNGNSSSQGAELALDARLDSSESLQTWVREQIQPSPTEPQQITDERDDKKATAATTSTTTANPNINRRLQQPEPPAVFKKSKNNSNNKKKNSLPTLKTLLLQQSSGYSHYGPALLEHCILYAALKPHEPLSTAAAATPTSTGNQTITDNNPISYFEQLDLSDWDRLRHSLQNEGPAVVERLQSGTTGTTGAAGYILYTPRPERHGASTTTTSNSNSIVETLPHADKLLEEFQPHLLLQHANRPHVVYSTFSSAVQDFFAQIVTQKQLSRALQAEQSAQDKLKRVKADQEARLQALVAEQESLLQQARAVEQNADAVEKALLVINSALDSGMDWDQLQQLVVVEQVQNQNPIALLIHQLLLDQEAMILRLPVDPPLDVGGATAAVQGNGESPTTTLNVRVSLKDTAHGNASALFAKYRAVKEKWQKTIEASSKVLAAAEEAAQRQLADAQQKKSSATAAVAASQQRKPAWFEKFHWFITTDNYLVLGGKDAHQNELLVKRYLRPGDAYLHADVHGAASCILRAKRRRRRRTMTSRQGNESTAAAAAGSGPGSGTEPLPLSEQALREAGNFTICRSSAWTSRMVTSAWWVESHQVSKTAPTGEYLTVGSFMVRGKKNFLPPTPLEMGLAILFRLGNDESIARHQNERRDFALLLQSSEEHSTDHDDDNEKEEILEKNDLGNGNEEERNVVDDPAETPQPKDQHEELKEIVDPIQGQEESESVASQDDENSQENQRRVDDEEGTDGDEEDKESDPDNGREFDVDQTKKKGLSARDRRLIKKYGSLEEAEKALRSNGKKHSSANENQAPAPSTSGAVKSAGESRATKRGKKAKLKRAMMKYGDQDEEDRELAMLALQGGEKAKKKKSSDNRKPKTVSEAQKKVAAETAALLLKDPAKVAEQLPEDVRSTLAECIAVPSDGKENVTIIKWEKLDADILEQLVMLEPKEAQLAAARRLLELKKSTRIDNFSASLAGILRTIRKFGHENLIQEAGSGRDKPKRKTKAQKDEEESKWKETLAEEGIVIQNNDDDAVDDTIELGKLTGKPRPEDLLVAAVPVCAPYQTLAQYTFRVKLTPGALKRGKAAKQCVELFLKGDAMKALPDGERYKELIKRVNDNDWIQTICADVKIATAGAGKVQKQQQKGNGKKSKK